MSPTARELLERYLARQRAGDAVDFEEWVREYPDEEAELRKLFARNPYETRRAAAPSGTTAADSFFRTSGEREAHVGPIGRAPLSPGDTIGEFLLIAPIGRGGMGEVWEAEQVLLRRRVALKLILPGRINQHNLELFAREARAGGRLNHPGIVRVHGYGLSDGAHWISQELIEGGWTLRDFIHDVCSLDKLPNRYYQRVADFVADLADALQAAHDAGVIHRDLKPQNILITPDDQPKLTDFGLARITDETAISTTGELAGTCLYMSPEQVAARSGPVDHRSDIFSLGIVIYEMLALQRPFEGDTAHQVVTKILEMDPPDLHRQRSRIPPDLAVICSKALEKRRSSRYQSMDELAAELRRYLANEPILARPPGMPRRMQKWVLRNPTKSAVGVVASVAFLVITILAVVAMRNARLADENALMAQATAAREKQRADEVLRLSALQKYDDLISSAARLVPPHPGLIADYRAWIAAARELVDELPLHERTRDELRADALPQSEEERKRDEWRFPATHEESSWWNSQLSKLITRLTELDHSADGLLGGGISEEYGWGMERRLAAAESLRDSFAPEGAFARRWVAARESIRAEYGRDLSTQIGLVPIGPDPVSGLWEFWHVLSGDEPERGEEGTIELTDAAGLVFVLLPGGTFAMGSQSDDESATNYDPHGGAAEGPVHDVDLTPFFLSKYELTQGQWKRLAGWNRSRYGVEGEWNIDWNAGRHGASFRLPVTDVSHVDCQRVMISAGLSLPTEAQWEYGARGDQDTVWWTGSERETLEGVANVVDGFAHDHGAPHWIGHEMWLNDGYTTLASADSLVANPFGLHQVHGNVWERCLDAYDAGFYGDSPRADPVHIDPDADATVSRGGGFGDGILSTRLACRKGFAPTYAGSRLGLRPARAIDG